MIGRYWAIAALSFTFAAVLVGQSPSDFDAIVKNADAARDGGDVDRAIGLYQQALQVKPDWKQGWWVLGSILYDSNRYQEGAEAFLPLTALDPEKSAGWAMAGLCEFETQQYRQALNHLLKAENLGLPKSLLDVTLYHIELILIRGSQFDAALEMLSQDSLRGTENPKLLEAMGIAALRKPLLPEQLPPSDHELVMSIGRAVCDAAAYRTTDATREFKSLLAKYPSLPQLHYLAGQVFLESDPDQAIADFTQELNLSPNHLQTLVSLASEYMKQNDYQTALRYAERAQASDSRYFAAHAMLGRVLVEGNLDMPRGIKELETSVQLAPDNPQCRVALASAYAKVGRKTDAAKERAEFLRLRKQADASNSGQK
jgi:tetratricopeptide (TPR) repeat protein